MRLLVITAVALLSSLGRAEDYMDLTDPANPIGFYNPISPNYLLDSSSPTAKPVPREETAVEKTAWERRKAEAEALLQDTREPNEILKRVELILNENPYELTNATCARDNLQKLAAVASLNGMRITEFASHKFGTIKNSISGKWIKYDRIFDITLSSSDITVKRTFSCQMRHWRFLH